MASFSPMGSPAPRRTAARRTPRPHGKTPPVHFQVPTRTTVPRSRLGTPIRPRAPSSDVASPSPGMDVDEEDAQVRVHQRNGNEIVFARSDELNVTFYASLPVEVRQMLKNANFLRDQYSGDIDTVTGFALITSAQTCFVWQHAQAVRGTPTCYIFSVPPDLTYRTAPLHALVPHGPGREPGLILLSAEGEIRFWESIGIGLAGGAQFSTTWLNIDGGERATNVIRVDPQSYVASTSAGHLFRLILTSAGGTYHLTVTPIVNPPSSALSLARLIPFWSSSAPSVSSLEPPVPGNISALALDDDNDAVWALMETRLQLWSLTEGCLLERELAEPLSDRLRDEFDNAKKDDAELDLELLDLVLVGDDRLAALVSYAGLEDASTVPIGELPVVKRIYVLARLHIQSKQNNHVVVEELRIVPYQSTSRSGAPMHPRVKLLKGGTIAIVQFGDAVALCAHRNPWVDRLELKSTSDRTLGVGVTSGSSDVLVLTAATMMRATVDEDCVDAFDVETGRVGLIKSIMTQAILYGSNADNPLHFSFPPDVDEESLMRGAEQLSAAALESDPLVVRPNLDLGAQIAARQDRLRWLIEFINENGVLTKMSASSRQRLATDAEKLFAAGELWLQHNHFLSEGNVHSVLAEAVEAYMSDAGEPLPEDFVRAFFCYYVADLGQLLGKVVDVTLRAAYELGRSMASALPEANEIVIVVLQAAGAFRKDHLGQYGVELPMHRPWSSTSHILNAVQTLFDTTTRLRDGGAAGDAGDQLPGLAEVLFRCTREQLDWLGSPVAAAESGTERERKALQEQFDQLRPDVLETLRRTGHADKAFELAEQYRDFHSLASLCHKETLFPPEHNPHRARIEKYIDMYRMDFTNELYQWFVEHGELRTMFAQDSKFDGYLDRYFGARPKPAISWIHDLGKQRYRAASDTLLAEAEVTTNLDTQHLMLSIGKLAHLAQAHGEEGAIDDSILDAFHDRLDFVSVHEQLLENLKAPLAGVRGKQSLDSQVDTISKAKAKSLMVRRALFTVFQGLVRQLLQGQTLCVEDLADLLSLMDNEDQVDNYVLALRLLSRDETIPQLRRLSAFRTVWRRIYIHDDWNSIRQTAGVTDAELNMKYRTTALFTAIAAVHEDDHPQPPEGYDLTPSQALVIPAAPEIASRWPGMAPDKVEDMMVDYQSESSLLDGLQLSDVYDRVRELAVHSAVFET